MIKNDILKPSYEVHRYDFTKLFMLGRKEGFQLICNESVIKNAEIKKSGQPDKKGNCQLFDQFLKEHPELNEKGEGKQFENVFINIDFTSYVSSKGSDIERDLLAIKNGIIFKYRNKKAVHFIDFLKSNSMSKHCCIFYINYEYKQTASERVLFNFHNEGDEIIMPKWYAYSGLVLSDTNIVDNVHLKPGEIVVVDDVEKTIRHDVYTAVSIEYLLNRYQDLLDALNESIDSDYDNVYLHNILDGEGINPTIRNIDREFQSYNKSAEVKKFDLRPEVKESPSKFFKRTNQEFIYILLRRFKKYRNECTIKEFKEFLSDSLANVRPSYEKAISLRNLPNNEIYWQMITADNCPVEINKFDGEGLISKEFLDEITSELNNKQETSNEYFGGSFQIRLPFIKGVVHSCNLKTFYKEHGITTIKGLTFNKEQPYADYDVNNIKMIITKSQFKAAKFFKNSKVFDASLNKFDAYINLLNDYDYALGVSFEHGLDDIYNTNHLVRLNYQFLSTIPFDKGTLDRIYTENKNKFAIKTSDDYIINNILKDNTHYYDSDKRLIKDFKDFYLSTDRYKNERNRNVNSYRNDLYKMKLYTYGYRKYLCADLLELLYSTCYKGKVLDKKFKSQKMELEEFYAPRTSLNKTRIPFVLLRNPHYSNREICTLKTVTKENERQKYFGHLTGVLMINPESCAAQKLGGADFDGDEVVLLTDVDREEYINKLETVATVKQLFISIPSLTSSRVIFNFENRAKCIKNTFSSRVGQISNNALTKLFALNKEGNLMDGINEIALYTILCGLEIDSVKNGLKPYLPPSTSDKCADFYIGLKDKLGGNTNITKKDKDVLSCDAFKDRNNILKLCNKLENLVEGTHAPNRYKLKAYSDINISKEELMKVIVSYLIYKKLHDANYIDNTKQDNVYGNILQICHNQDYIDDLIDNFASEDAASKLNKYCDKNITIKFHYLTSKKDKLDYIHNVLGYSLDTIKEEYLDRVCDFSNNGMYLLYYILVYLRNRENRLNKFKDALIDVNDSKLAKEREALYQVLFTRNYFDDDDKYDLDDEFHYEVNIINEIIENANDHSDEINTVNKELREYLKDVNFDNYLYFGTHNTDSVDSKVKSALKGNPGNSFVFDVMIDNLIEYLK